MGAAAPPFWPPCWRWSSPGHHLAERWPATSRRPSESPVPRVRGWANGLPPRPMSVSTPSAASKSRLVVRCVSSLRGLGVQVRPPVLGPNCSPPSWPPKAAPSSPIAARPAARRRSRWRRGRPCPGGGPTLVSRPAPGAGRARAADRGGAHIVQVGLVARDQILVVHTAREAAREAAVDPSPEAAGKPERRLPGLTRPASTSRWGSGARPAVGCG